MAKNFLTWDYWKRDRRSAVSLTLCLDGCTPNLPFQFDPGSPDSESSTALILKQSLLCQAGASSNLAIGLDTEDACVEQKRIFPIHGWGPDQHRSLPHEAPKPSLHHLVPTYKTLGATAPQ